MYIYVCNICMCIYIVHIHMYTSTRYVYIIFNTSTIVGPNSSPFLEKFSLNYVDTYTYTYTYAHIICMYVICMRIFTHNYRRVRSRLLH